MKCHLPAHGPCVALRKESVDRNARTFATYDHSGVALRKESVDRNPGVCIARTNAQGRSPQGERG